MVNVQDILGESIKGFLSVKIGIVIPVHNEARSIGLLVQKIKAKNLDVLVVDDGSGDHSGSISSKQGAFVIRNDTKMGKGKSLQKGFEYFLQKNYDGIIAMDGDGQHDVADLVYFLKKAEQVPISIVIGTRMENPKNMPGIRYWTNRLMSGLISLTCGQEIPDTQCGYRYLSCEILKQIHLTCSDFEIETEVIMKATQNGFPIYSVPIKTIYEDENSKINPFKDTIRFVIYFIKELCRFKTQRLNL